MNRRRLLQTLVSCTALLVACGRPDAAAVGGSARAADTAAAPLDPERAVRRLVTLFGSRMQTVSLLVPDSIAASRLQEAYGTLVTPDLLSDWMARPTVAPGRRVSSPWPDRIEVKSVTPAGADEYLVTGSLIFESSASGESVSRAAVRPVRLHVRRSGDGNWRISMYEQTPASVDAS
jgi:hypothetical protein